MKTACLKSKRIKTVTSNLIIDETATLLRARLGIETVLRCKQILINSRLIQVIRVTAADEARAWEWMKRNWSSLSYTNCVSFSQMQRLAISQACSFDKHFTRAGFSIINS